MGWVFSTVCWKAAAADALPSQIPLLRHLLAAHALRHRLPEGAIRLGARSMQRHESRGQLVLDAEDGRQKKVLGRSERAGEEAHERVRGACDGTGRDAASSDEGKGAMVRGECVAVFLVRSGDGILTLSLQMFAMPRSESSLSSRSYSTASTLARSSPCRTPPSRTSSSSVCIRWTLLRSARPSSLTRFVLVSLARGLALTSWL